jgi:hypothetical protein
MALKRPVSPPPGGLLTGMLRKRVGMVPARAQHAIERFEVLIGCLRILSQHLAHPDDSIEGRTQLMAHIGEELLCWLASAS